MMSRATTIALVLVSVTTPLLLWSLHPVRLVEVHIYPGKTHVVQFSPDVVLVRQTGPTAFLYFQADSTEEIGDSVMIQLYVDDSSKPVEAGPYEVMRGHIRGVWPLGSTAHPLTEKDHPFVIVDAATRRPVSDGTISTHVTKLAGADTWLIAAVGILASVIQIVDAFVRWLLKRD